MDSPWGTVPQKKSNHTARSETPASGSKLVQLQRANNANGKFPANNSSGGTGPKTSAAPTSSTFSSPAASAGQQNATSSSATSATLASASKHTAGSGGLHPLRVNWVFWFMHRPPGNKITDYEGAMKKIGAFTSVEDFWAIYSHLRRPDELPNVSDYHLFKSGVRPVWEDKENVNGGKWIVRLKKGLASRYWEYLVMAVIGEQFDVGEEICGLVLSIRNSEDILSLWNRSSSEGRINLKIRDTMKRVLELPVDTMMEYKAHNVSIHDQSSFRNTDVFR